MSKVFLNACEARYPKAAPFHPEEIYEEFKEAPWVSETSSFNPVYAGVRALLLTAYGEKFLSAIIKPGDRVVVKPNLVIAAHETRPLEWEQVITHGAVLRAVIDYVLLALEGRGEIFIAEAPQTDTSFAKVTERAGVLDVVSWYQKNASVPVKLLDLRKEEWETKDGIVIKRTALPGDPNGYVAVDLGSSSAFAETDDRTAPLYGADYDLSVTAAHHSGGKHEYLLSGTVLNCDVLINLPKLKTHKKTGLTAAMKNLVGINGDKNWLPHYRLGDPETGGDQFSKHNLKTQSETQLVTAWKNLMLKLPASFNVVFKPLKALARQIYGDTHKVVRSGNWHGNDTCWRMVWDLNAALLKAGKMRTILSLVDGVVAGEGDGPLAPDAKPCGWLALSEDSQAMDEVLAKLMGFQAENLKFLNRPLKGEKIIPEKVFVSEEAEAKISKTPPFKPHFGWAGYLDSHTDTKNGV